MINRKMFFPLILGSALVLTACGTADNNANNATTTPENNQEQSTMNNDVNNDVNNESNENVVINDDEPTNDTVTDTEHSDLKITPEEAYDTFVAKYPDAKVSQIELDESMGEYVYKVDGFDDLVEYEMTIDAVNGDITRDESETDDDTDNQEITREHAEKVVPLVENAMTEAGQDARLTEWTLENDDGRIELELEIDVPGLDDIEHTYDVETGELIDRD